VDIGNKKNFRKSILQIFARRSGITKDILPTPEWQVIMFLRSWKSRMKHIKSILRRWCGWELRAVIWKDHAACGIAYDDMRNDY